MDIAWIMLIGTILLFVGVVLLVLYIERRKEKKKLESYLASIRKELGTIHLLGSPDIDSLFVRLEDAFVSPRISESRHSENRFDVAKNRTGMETCEDGRYFTPEEVIKRAFKQYRLLLIIGDPGSGKTTLLKYYALSCLDKTAEKWKEFGFESQILPLYFPLRELEFDEEDEPVSLPVNLGKWFDRRLLDFSTGFFNDLLDNKKNLVLLDGLDEISSKERRRKVCRWLGNLCSVLPNTRFVVTSRATGYRKLDGIELEIPHLRADILDFSTQQQEEFIHKWLGAALLSELPPGDIDEQEWRQRQENLAQRQSNTIIEFLRQGDNKVIRELAAVPMLLQIMAILWKDRQHLPESRSELYDATLNYLLEYRDRKRDIKPVLWAEKARRVLEPTALWMQEKLRRDEVPKEVMHQFMQPILDTLDKQPKAELFCENLRDRAGLIVEYDKDHYIFRHKSFREYLAARQLQKEAHKPGRLESIIDYFSWEWWEETLRFFFSEIDDTIFDRFMYLFFKSNTSKQLDDHRQSLLQALIKESPQQKIDALVDSLYSGHLNNNQERYVLDCLKTIGSPDAVMAIETFIEKNESDKAILDHARDIVTELTAKKIVKEEPVEENRFQVRPATFFRNPFEDHVEYIHIPGGQYTFSVTGRNQSVPGFYLCKYPVTNKQFRQFISFLAGNEKELLKLLPLEVFAERLLKFAQPIEGYSAFLGEDFKEWQFKLRSRLDEDKTFNGDDQPVTAVSWYAARAYCLWLSCLEIASRGDVKFESSDIDQPATIYRLPTEKEWEWAAGGESEAIVRDYPWPKYKGEPNPNLANYNKNVGATTPVGRYPEGATPRGLMEMAGNAWEWMENYYEEGKSWYALRGGSWYDGAHHLRCTARSSGGANYQYDVIGFRVLRTQY